MSSGYVTFLLFIIEILLINIVDRDGVLFDTCRLNVDAYSYAAHEIGVELNLELLKMNICAGESAHDFIYALTPGLEPSLFARLSRLKSGYFRENIHLVNFNRDLFKSLQLPSCKNYLLTKASLASTTQLLAHYSISSNFEEVFSLQGSGFNSKVEFLQNFLHGDLRLKILVIDDSKATVSDFIANGFEAALYPHFCSIDEKGD